MACKTSEKMTPIRLLSANAWGASVCGSKRANSSPPKRNAESEVRRDLRSVEATARNTSSPRRWPSWSFTSLKRWRSKVTRENGWA